MMNIPLRPNLFNLVLFVTRNSLQLFLKHSNPQWTPSLQNTNPAAKLTLTQKNVLIGLLLGSSAFSIFPCIEGTFFRSIQQREFGFLCLTPNVEFALLLHLVFEEYIQSPIQVIVKNGIEYYKVESFKHRVFAQYQTIFYSLNENKIRQKKLPSEVDGNSLLNREVLAIWFQSSCTKTEKGYIFCTDFLFEFEAAAIQIDLRRLFDIDAELEKDGVFWSFHINEPFSQNKISYYVLRFLLVSNLSLLHQLFHENMVGFKTTKK